MFDKNPDATTIASRSAANQRQDAARPGTVTLDDTQAKGPAVDGAVLDRLEKSLKASKGRAGDLEAALEAYLADHGSVVHGTINAQNVDVAVNCTCPLCLVALKLLGRKPRTEFA